MTGLDGAKLENGKSKMGRYKSALEGQGAFHHFNGVAADADVGIWSADLLARNRGWKLEKGNLKMGKPERPKLKNRSWKRAIGKSKFARDPTGRQSA
jgi:hypothetical protein